MTNCARPCSRLAAYGPVAGNIEHSTKMMVAMSLLKEGVSCGDKLSVFSQSLNTLECVEVGGWSCRW